MSGMDILLTSMADVEAVSRLLTSGVTKPWWLIDVSVKLVTGGGISLGAPVKIDQIQFHEPVVKIMSYLPRKAGASLRYASSTELSIVVENVSSRLRARAFWKYSIAWSYFKVNAYT